MVYIFIPMGKEFKNLVKKQMKSCREYTFKYNGVVHLNQPSH